MESARKIMVEKKFSLGGKNGKWSFQAMDIIKTTVRN